MSTRAMSFSKYKIEWAQELWVSQNKNLMILSWTGMYMCTRRWPCDNTTRSLRLLSKDDDKDREGYMFDHRMEPASK